MSQTAKINMVSFQPSALVDYLAANKPTQGVKSYELLLAVILGQFCELQFNTPCGIAFEIQDKHWKSLPQKENATLDEIAGVLNEMVRQDSDIDVGVTMGSKVIAFQLKRYFKQKDNSPKGIAAYVAKQKAKYGSKLRPVTFFLLLEGGGELDLMEVVKELDMQDFPFSKLMFAGLDSKTSILHIGEFWPTQGRDEYKVVNGHLVKLP